MNPTLALRVLDRVMNWDNERARKEFAWVRLMSDFKYDGYRDFLAGLHFTESLTAWLQQFHQSEREAAYEFVRNHLVFISTAEIQHLVERTYYDTVLKKLTAVVAKTLSVPAYLLWSDPKAKAAYNKLLRKTLFFGLSDGARIDIFRRVNAGIISNEQVVGLTQIDEQKWNDLLNDLRKDLDDPKETFSFVFLVDDFVGSGKSLLRKEESAWKGKLVKFYNAVHNYIPTHFETGWKLGIHHYIASHQASLNIPQVEKQIYQEKGGAVWFDRNMIEFSYGIILPESLRMDDKKFPDFMRLVDLYYDPAIPARF